MKTLINKNNPQIRITAPEITIAPPPIGSEGYVYWIPAINEMYNPIDWTLVEEEPEKVNCPFDKGDCRYCTVQFCGAREENHIETRSTAEPVDLEKAADDYVMQTASGTAEEMETLIDAFKAGAEWMKKQPITFNCIGKQVTMTVQQLIDYYIDRECTDVAYECGF